MRICCHGGSGRPSLPCAALRRQGRQGPERPEGAPGHARGKVDEGARGGRGWSLALTALSRHCSAGLAPGWRGTLAAPAEPRAQQGRGRFLTHGSDIWRGQHRQRGVAVKVTGTTSRHRGPTVPLGNGCSSAEAQSTAPNIRKTFRETRGRCLLP